MKQIFLNREKSAIDSVIDYLFNRYSKDNAEWDMSKVLLVVPSVRVRIETMHQILILAEKVREKNENFVWEMPQIVTIGRALEYFYRQTRPLADDITQSLTWNKAVDTSNEKLRNRFFPVTVNKGDLTKQILFGQMLKIIHENLAAEGLSFADVAQKLTELQNDPSVNFGKLNLQNEIVRWEYLSKVEKNYLSILDKLNLWDRQAARRYALKFPQKSCNGFPGDFEIDYDVVLAGIVDLNKIQKEMLQRVEEHVTALIYAPESESEGFDAFGSLNVEYWSKDLLCPLSENEIVQVDKPEDQVLCAFDFIRRLSKDYCPNDFVIGAPDENMIPYIQSAADKLGLQIDNTIGIPLSSTAPGALLSAIAEFLEMHDFESFANLVRHPAVYDQLTSNVLDPDCEIVSILDSYQQEHFPLDVSSGFQSNPFNDDLEAIKAAFGWVRDWLSDLNKKEIAPKDLRKIIARLFKSLPKDKYVLNRNAQGMLINIAGKLETIPADLTGKLTPDSALKLLILHSKSYTLPNGSEEVDEFEEFEPDAASKPMIHLAGWLELVWDRSPVLAILSFNEGVVPQSVNAHLFLPNELRKALGITDNDRRFARDAYALKAMSSSKKHILAICGKRDTEGKPTLPSRLLFNKGDKKDELKTFALQSFRLFNPKQPLPKFTLEELASKDSESLINYINWSKENLSGGVLRGAVTEVSATKFRDYIQCPFRFYLKHVLQIQPTDYTVNEMTPFSFGTFVHQVLQEWALGEIENGQQNKKKSAVKIFNTLNALVDKIYKKSYPKSVLPGIAIQKEIIKQRLKAFAEFQSHLNGEILAVEQTFEQVVKINNSKKETVTLKGKIDRIDRLPDGTIILLDYKTSGNDPYEDHIGKNKAAADSEKGNADSEKGDDSQNDQDEDKNAINWINLQLPIYRQIILANRKDFEWMTPKTEVQVGYINIPQDLNVELKNPCIKPEGDKSKKPVWDESVFASAEELTSQILNNIYNGVFWPPTPTKDMEYDDYADLVCWLENMEENW